MQNGQNIVLVGYPGCGKTTLADEFVHRTSFPYRHISSGRIATELAEAGDMNTQSALQQGDYAPESAIRNEVKAQIEHATFLGHPFMMDGFPRRWDQLMVLEEVMEAPPLYVFVEVAPLLCLRRIINRKREYDHPDAVASRFDAFYRDTRPMIRMLNHGGFISHIDNNGNLDDGLKWLKKVSGVK